MIDDKNVDKKMNEFVKTHLLAEKILAGITVEEALNHIPENDTRSNATNRRFYNLIWQQYSNRLIARSLFFQYSLN